MIHYHGLPITPATAAARVVNCGHPFVSFLYPDQLGLVLECASTFAVDNGAFTLWKKSISARADGDLVEIGNWALYYEWVAELHRYPQFDFAVIPDVIDGDESDNDALIAEWPWRKSAPHVGAPVWHMHESLERLERLALEFPRVCIGSSGQFSIVGSQAWWNRMAEAMDVVCDRDGRPICKLHGLRMLDPEIFTRLPLASADSTNIARNIGIDQAWRGTYTPPNKEARAAVMRERIESQQSPTFWQREAHPIQESLFMETA